MSAARTDLCCHLFVYGFTTTMNHTVLVEGPLMALEPRIDISDRVISRCTYSLKMNLDSWFI
jgi:hypothetical protein